MPEERFKRLTQVEPKSKEPCLCGSGKRFKNCCRDQYRTSPWKKLKDVELSPKQKLRAARAHITWYRLCHQVNTKPVLESGSSDAQQLLELDINAMSGLIDRLRDQYSACGKSTELPSALEHLRDSIDDDRWKTALDFQICSTLAFDIHDRAAARRISLKHDWHVLDHVEFLTLWFDLNSGQLNQLDRIEICKRIVSLAEDPAVVLQYTAAVGVEHCLLQDVHTGVAIVFEAIHTFEESLDQENNHYGTYQLAHAYQTVAAFTGDKEHAERAAILLHELLKEDLHTPAGKADLWMWIGDSYRLQDRHEEAQDALRKSIELNETNLANIYLGKAEIELRQYDSARTRFAAVRQEELSKENRFDLTTGMGKLAVRTRDRQDIENTLAELREIESKASLFQKCIQELLVEMHEIRDQSKSSQSAETLLSQLAKLSKYLHLRPNIFGVGLNINAMLEHAVDDDTQESSFD